MGVWGVGLYEDDVAADLKKSISLIAKIPVRGEQLLEIILKQAGGGPDLTEDGGPTFWLVVADQFERRGIHSSVVFGRALKAIEGGFDIGDLEARGQDARGLQKRKAMLEQLARRLHSPRPERILPKKPKLPDPVVQVGEIYAFPTMSGLPFATYINSAADLDRRNFHQDGWGAVVVVDQGRAFDWLPWCALASVSVEQSKLPTLPDLLEGELLYHSQTKGVTRCVPKRSELKDIPFQLVGKIRLNDAAQSVIAKWPNVEESIEFGWSLRTVAFGRNCRFSLPKGPRLSALVE